MNIVLSQQDINEYASSSEATKEKPGTPYYADGVEVNYTAPAKWWNWLLNKVTKGLTAIKTDKSAIIPEMANLLSAAEITASSADEHQLSKAVDKLTYENVSAYDNEEITEEIYGQMVTHKKNKPFVVGSRIYLPPTELL